MKAHEHRALGDEATGGATVTLGGDDGGGGLALRFGDVIALTGDYFLPTIAPALPVRGPEGLVSGGLFHLAPVPGERGARPGTSDEVVCALKVMAVDQGLADPRFGAGGQFAGYRFSPTASETEVERRVRDRFLALGASNDDHFVVPGRRGAATEGDRAVPRFGSAPLAYRTLHQLALDEAFRLGRIGGDPSPAMAWEAAAQHYLTDAFAAGHLRTPVAAIREYWQSRYPAFWEGLRRKVSSDTAGALREPVGPLRLLPPRYLRRRTLSAVRARTEGYPRISLGDLLAKVFHDWDNRQGLVLEGGGVLFGDGCLDDGVTRKLALAAVRAGIDDVDVAHRLGAAGRDLQSEPLYAAVREATGATGNAFRAEASLPEPSRDNPPQNWQAADLEALWTLPVVGSTGTTVGEAVGQALEEGEELPNRLECLGHGIVNSLDLPAVPMLRRWLGRRVCEAYHRGFIGNLVSDPRSCLLDVLEGEPRTGSSSAGRSAPAATG